MFVTPEKPGGTAAGMRGNPDRAAAPSVTRLAVAALVLLGLAWWHAVAVGADRHPVADERFYLAYALSLHDHGVVGEWRPDEAAPTPDRMTTPLYPLLVAGMMAADPTLTATVRCVVSQPPEKTATCPAALGIAPVVQGGLAAVATVATAATVLALGGGPLAAGLAAVIVVASKGYVHWTDHFLTEALYLPLLAVATWLIVLAARSRRPWAWLGGAGVFIGLAALARPSFLYLPVLLAPALPFLLPRTPAGRVALRQGLAGALALAIGFAAVNAPWLGRNLERFGDARYTDGYSWQVLSTRVAYNTMTAQEWLAGWIYWLPDFGDGLAAQMFGPQTVERLDLGSPRGFYSEARAAVREEMRLNTDGSAATPDGWLLRERVLGDLPWHTAVSVLLAWRGAMVEKYFGLAGVLLGLWLLASGRADRRLVLALAAPGVLMLGFNAFFTLNIPRYNAGLIQVYAVAGGIAFAALAGSVAGRLRRRSGGAAP